MAQPLQGRMLVPGEAPSRQRDAARGCRGRDHPPSCQTPPLPRLHWQGKVLMPSTSKPEGKKKTSRKEVQSGITKKSEAREQKSPLAPFLGTENGFPEQYHSFDMPVLVSRLPEDENRLKKNLLGGSAHCNATSNAIKRSTPAPGAPHPHALVVK